jgi:acetylornithine/succinyldiaminopimelate/putrescine aminotransferase
MFALEHESVVPDVLIVSKSLGGGVMPLSACVTTPTIWNRVYGTVRSFRLHQSSFSGNALACISGLATLTTLVEERLCENAETQGRYFRDGLIRLAEVHETLVEVRGRGLMIGVRLDVDAGGLIEGISKRVLGPLAGQMVTAHIASRLLNEFHVIVAPSLTDECVIQLFPPLTVTSRDIDYFLEAFGAVCGSVGTHTDVLRKTTRQLARQVVARVRHN